MISSSSIYQTIQVLASAHPTLILRSNFPYCKIQEFTYILWYWTVECMYLYIGSTDHFITNVHIHVHVSISRNINLERLTYVHRVQNCRQPSTTFQPKLAIYPCKQIYIKVLSPFSNYFINLSHTS